MPSLAPSFNEPLVFSPFFRPQVWGGQRLAELLNKPLPSGVSIGESWELSAQSRHHSLVQQGPFAGKTLPQLWQTAREKFIGSDHPEVKSFPWLIKWLDCHADLSVQVHPDDALAQRLLGEPNGKTESWVILRAEPTARIYAGWKAGVTRADVVAALAAGSVAECLHRFTPTAGQCIHIPAGTVHALSGGIVLAEIQQTSDATFRLFDWNRVDGLGHARPLHLATAMEAADFTHGPVSPITPSSLPDSTDGAEHQLLVECPYYRLERLQLTRSWMAPQGGLSALIMISGSAVLQVPGVATDQPLHRGMTVLLPAVMPVPTIQPTDDAPAVLLKVCLPNPFDRSVISSA